MKYENIKHYSESNFRRITGIKRSTFLRMIEILLAKYADVHSKNIRNSGRKPKLSIEDQLLATLEYLREYRTYAHIAANYGVSESSIYRIIKCVEDTLIQDGIFSLPGKKALVSSDTE
jgi:predicted DNA-binding transcriptional regulator AlpA